jgi:predicted DNA-binding protein
MRKSTISSDREFVTSLRLSSDHHEALKRIAARENRSLSGQVRHFIERAIAEGRDRDSETPRAA